MTDPSLGKKKRKITITASPMGVDIAEKALVGLGFESKSNFAKSRLLARNTVTKFFQCQPIQLDTFKKICEELQLNWKVIAGIQEEQSERLDKDDYVILDIDQRVESIHTNSRLVTVRDIQSKIIKAEIKLKGDIDSVQNWRIIQSILREYSGDTVEIIDIKEGSIRLFVKGTPEEIERLVYCIKSGELTELSGFHIEDIQIVSESSDDDGSTKIDEKWRLVQEIVNQVVEGQNLSGADLSDADLSGTNLYRADLSDVNLTGADLSSAYLISANLSGADLSSADLSIANLSIANLSNANLTGANLSGANLTGANLTGANLTGADLSSADLTCANLSIANLSIANLSIANLTGANLTGANLSSANLTGANLSSADLSSADLSRAIIDDSTKLDRKWYLVWQIIIHGAEGRDLTGANLSRANLSRANLSRTDLSSANLSRTDLSGANLTGADLSRANLTGADLSRANLTGANLSRADLSRADLSRANLSRTDLSRANLSDANLSRANLSRANLSRADLSGTDLSRADVVNARFGNNPGIFKLNKRDLIQRGAIFGKVLTVRFRRYTVRVKWELLLIILIGILILIAFFVLFLAPK